MEITLTTPALLFPAISLLLLAYTNRYVAIANVIRNFKKDYDSGYKHIEIVQQMKSLRKRIEIIRHMQSIGIGSLILASMSMFAIFANWQFAGKTTFGLALGFLITSMLLSFYETRLSNQSIMVEINDVLQKESKPNHKS